jgi:hypothetical protein
MEQGACRYRSMVVTSGAFIHMASMQQPTFLMATAFTMETFWPPQFYQGLKAVLFIRKLLLPLPKTCDFCLHESSPGYQFIIWIF